LAELHKSASGKGVTIAIVDSGIDASHPDLSGQLQFNRNFVEGRPLSAEQHGTGIAGIIAAKANNRQGMVGVAPGARLLGLRACWQRTNHSLCDSLSLAKALHFAIKKDADIINLSLAGPPSKLLNALVAKMVANGSVVVAAVDPTNQGDVFPSSSKGVVSVTDEKSVMLTKNQYRAPGSYVPTTQLNSKWFMVHGTSYSAAHVSGLYALMIEKRGSSSRPLTLIREEDGSGKIDTRASLKSAAGR
jgi:subtilisin family serine protease